MTSGNNIPPISLDQESDPCPFCSSREGITFDQNNFGHCISCDAILLQVPKVVPSSELEGTWAVLATAPYCIDCRTNTNLENVHQSANGSKTWVCHNCGGVWTDDIGEGEEWH